MKVLCLHGWRTSGQILTMQMAAFRYHTGAEYVAVTSPLAADGPPDPLIGMIYSSRPYYQWYYRHDTGDGNVAIEGMEESVSFLVDYIRRTGPVDGILGFSQGAAMATILLDRLRADSSSDIVPPKFAILIGGIQPPPQFAPESPLSIRSLHIMGKADPLLSRSEQLVEYFRDSLDLRTVLFHEEGHQIPSIRTGLYPLVKDWIFAPQD